MDKMRVYSQDKDPVTRLTARQREVLKMTTEDGLSQLEIAERLNVSRQRVRQIVETLITKGYYIPGAKPPANCR